MNNKTWICVFLCMAVTAIEGRPGKTADGSTKPRLRYKRAMAIRNEGEHLRWPKGVIPYSIDQSEFTPAEIKITEDAMAEWSKYTCLKFTRSPSAANRMVIKNGKWCRSHLGMAPSGTTAVELAKGCRKTGIVLHELGHAIGLIHEMSRPDRDWWITLRKENIKPESLDSFKKFAWKDVEDLKTPYDTDGIMHYNNMEYSNGGGPTYELSENNSFDTLFDQTPIDVLTIEDYKTVNLMYNCPVGPGHYLYQAQSVLDDVSGPTAPSDTGFGDSLF